MKKFIAKDRRRSSLREEFREFALSQGYTQLDGTCQVDVLDSGKYLCTYIPSEKDILWKKFAAQTVSIYLVTTSRFCVSILRT